MQKDQIDQGLVFKKRARRRLVGAIALVLLMIIILPMVLEDREKSGPQEKVTILMPDADGQPSGMETSTDLEPNTNGDAIASLENEVVDLPSPEVVLEAPKSKQKKEVKPAEDKEVSAKKLTATKDEASNKFYVQIGVFSDPENVKKLQSKLGDLGYKSLTEKMSTATGEKTRLRTETFIGRNEAAIALENIKDAGLTGMVVNQK